MEKKYYEQLIILRASIEANKQEMRANKQYYDWKMIKFTEEFKTMFVEITDHINTLKPSPNQKDSPKPPDPICCVPR